MSNSRGRIFWTVFALVSIIIGTAIAIRYAKGYRPTKDGIVAGRGLLVANSSPTGARIFVNGRFTSATDDTLYLDPGTYDVEIKKDGYFSWAKKLLVEQELVTQANALLFPVAPSLSPLTLAGAVNVTPSPDGQRLAFYTASASASTSNGYYVLELTNNPLGLQRTSRQIAEPSANFPYGQTMMLWSPNSQQLLMLSPTRAVMADPGRLNKLDELPDISLQLNTIFSQWEEEMYLRDRQRLAKFPPLIQEVATASAVNVYFSPDEERLLYTATKTFTLPENILPAKPGSNSQPQERTTQVGGIYVYDQNEDRQFRVGTDNTLTTLVAPTSPSPAPRSRGKQTATPSATPAPLVKKLLSDDLAGDAKLLKASPSAFTRLRAATTEDTVRNFRIYHSPLFSHGIQWFPNSYHLITHDTNGITIKEYDNTNPVQVYSGPTASNFVYPWPNGSRLIIYTNFNPSGTTPANLYTIELK